MTAGGLPATQVQLNLIAQGLVIASTATNDDGRFQFFVKVAIPDGKTIDVTVATTDGAVTSNIVTLKKTRPKRR